MAGKQMLSPITSPSSLQNTTRRQFSLTSFRPCLQLQQHLIDTAIRRISADLLKSLTAIKRTEFVEAKARMDIPHGMFGLSLDNFYQRRKENIVYVDVLEKVCREILEQAKVCILLEDLQDFVSRLFLGYQSKNMNPILKDIANSEKLLTVSETIAMDFKKNSATLQKLRDKLNAFSVHERNATIYMNNQVYEVQNNCAEVELVLDPIEFRYKLNYHNRTREQSEQKLRQTEEELQGTLDKIESDRNREDIVTDCVRMKQRTDIDVLRSKLEAMSEKYERDYDNLDGQISYKLNALEAMQDQRRDCLAKMEFFASEIVKLKEWELKKRAETLKVVAKRPKKKKPAKRMEK